MLEQSILAYLNINSTASSLEIAKAVAAEASYSTVKRMLSALVEKEWVVTIGNRKSTRYQLSPAYNLLKEIEVDAYFLQEQDERSRKPIPYNEKLLNDLLLHQPLFTKTEADKLNDLQGQWEEKISDMTEAARWLAFERWMIDLSWKSAQIEGNTY
ncbi:MAG: BlaI/MecI/CopY family transcriptional regulator, partial [Chitinophagaceae bacterium]|nr:BlaI/MecI/CopY family transcriptional regulator [Chitinophagaceae bacterium]